MDQRRARIPLMGAVLLALAYGHFASFRAGAPETPAFAFAAIACGFFFVDRSWFAAGLVTVLADGMYVGARVGFSTGSVRTVVGAAIIATLIHLLRRVEAANRKRLERSEAQARESEARQRAIAEAAFEGICFHRGGKVLDFNDAFARMYGYSRAQMLALDVQSLIAPESRSTVEAHIQSPADEAYEIVCLRRDGSRFYVEVAAKNVDHHGEPARVVAVRDVTERRRAEEALRRNERLSSLGTLVAGVAHEINNPLAYVNGRAELAQLTTAEILEDPATPPQMRARLEEIRDGLDAVIRGGDQLAEITRSLKLVARSSTGSRTAEDVNRLIGSVMTVAAPRISHDALVETDLRASHPIDVNASEITQVLVNLLFNAADAVRGRPQPHLVVRSHDADGRVVIEVEDNGIGICPDQAAKIFTPFHTTKPDGTGLGLSVSHGIVAAHGGSLSFRSDPDVGTTFRVELPVAA